MNNVVAFRLKAKAADAPPVQQWQLRLDRRTLEFVAGTEDADGAFTIHCVWKPDRDPGAFVQAWNAMCGEPPEIIA